MSVLVCGYVYTHLEWGICGRAYLDRGLRRTCQMLVPTGCIPDRRRGFVLFFPEVPLLLNLENLFNASSTSYPRDIFGIRTSGSLSCIVLEYLGIPAEILDTGAIERLRAERVANEYMVMFRVC